MSLSYSEDGDRILIEGEPCPSCGSTATLKDTDFGFWKCEDCSTVWGHDKDDPDYDEAEPCPVCLGTGSIQQPDGERAIEVCYGCDGSGCGRRSPMTNKYFCYLCGADSTDLAAMTDESEMEAFDNRHPGIDRPLVYEGRCPCCGFPYKEEVEAVCYEDDEPLSPEDSELIEQSWQRFKKLTEPQEDASVTIGTWGDDEAATFMGED